MYKTIVNTRKMDDLTTLYPVAIWMIFGFIGLFGLFFTYFAVIFLEIAILGIIPMFYFWRKIIKAIRLRKIGYVRKEVTFDVVNGELYIDDKKMNVFQNKSKREIYVDDCTIEAIKAENTIRGAYSTFIGIIEEPYVNDFEKFLLEQGVVIGQFPTKKEKWIKR